MMRFICDVMLGKLAKKLRMLGLDTSYHHTITEECLIDAALKEDRIVLTRKTDFPAKNKSLHVIFIMDNNPRNQLKQIVSHFKINREIINPFSRCISCNKELMPLEKELAGGKVADYIFNTIDTFKACPVCKKIYWSGTHLENMNIFINKIFM